MTSKERVCAALDRQPTDRVPIFMWFHPDTATRLSRLLEVPAARLGDAFGNDVHQTWVNNNYAMEGIAHERDGDSHVDFWGITWVKYGPFNQITRYPLAGRSREAVLRYGFPVGCTEDLLALMEPVLAQGGGHFVGCDVSPCVFEMYWRLRGMVDAIADMATDRALVRAMLGRCADFAARLAEAACERFPIDWLWTGDDVASQEAMMVSPTMWRDLIRPELQRVFDIGRQHEMPIAYHCCGALRPIIPDLIEMGMSVLNPVQSSARDMDPLELKREFGKQIAFMGGVDTQYLLPSGTAAEVHEATERLIDGMTGDGGGYILAASHTIPPETPDRNIFAMYDAAGLTKEEIFDRSSQIRSTLAGVP